SRVHIGFMAFLLDGSGQDALGPSLVRGRRNAASLSAHDFAGTVPPALARAQPCFPYARARSSLPSRAYPLPAQRPALSHWAPRLGPLASPHLLERRSQRAVHRASQ